MPVEQPAPETLPPSQRGGVCLPSLGSLYTPSGATALSGPVGSVHPVGGIGSNRVQNPGLQLGRDGRVFVAEVSGDLLNRGLAFDEDGRCRPS
jgi:hypothetical protein